MDVQVDNKEHKKADDKKKKEMNNKEMASAIEGEASEGGDLFSSGVLTQKDPFLSPKKHKKSKKIKQEPHSSFEGGDDWDGKRKSKKIKQEPGSSFAEQVIEEGDYKLKEKQELDSLFEAGGTHGGGSPSKKKKKRHRRDSCSLDQVDI